MTRGRLALAALIGMAVAAAFVACGDRHATARTPEQVPASYRDVRLSAGHQAHLGKVACIECHGRVFEKPPLTVCASCHAVATPLHPPDPTATVPAPQCVDCHPFGAEKREPWGCIRCHAKDQGRVAAIGAHADQACGDCHRPHQAPATLARACTDCHAAEQTSHAGLHGCRDCHDVHEGRSRATLAMAISAPPAGTPAPDARCEACHAGQHGKLAVDARALTTGHTACTTCHQPHQFTPRACATCHTDRPVIAAAKHTCIGCHDQHRAGAVRPCATCHQEHVVHPDATHAAAGACVGCHPPHDGLLAAFTAGAPLAAAELAKLARTSTATKPAVACTTCHHQTSHRTAACLDCHQAHGPAPVLGPALCARCHAENVRTTAGTGHARCTQCHATAAHDPQPAPACATCHAAEVASAPAGHATCTSCHSAHAPRPEKACASCHAMEGSTGHGTRLACTTCHRPHGPNGPARPPACASCHPADQRAGLHQVAGHTDCVACHRSHEARPRDDRATCIACHADRADHQPAATECKGCHPFR